MAILTRDQKIEIYYKRKSRETFTNLSAIYGVNKSLIKYLVKPIDIDEYKILRNNSNKYYRTDFKLHTINRVLINHESVNYVTLDIG